MPNATPERYKQIRKLGEGGMGAVWLAFDNVLKRQVAIKYMQLGQHDVYIDLFVNEAEILASLNHPNITAIYDAVLDKDNQQFYFVMEYVDGKSLSTLIYEKGQFPLDLSLEIATKLLLALKYAHQRDVIHRDLKPGNIIITEEIKLVDFGLADLASRLSTGSKYALGTHGYMSPEQGTGDPTDARTDLYAFGVVLFNMLTGGRMPFDAEGSWPEHPARLREFVPDAPVVLERMILRLLAVNPDDRFRSADEILHILRALRGQLTFAATSPNILNEVDPKPLVGRENQLRQMVTTWQKVQETSQPNLLLLKGGAGVGKKRLAIELLNSVINQGGNALGAKCDELNSPYLPFVEILEAIFSRSLAPVPDHERCQSLLRQMPGLATILQAKIPADSLDPQSAQGACFEAVNYIFEQLGPTLIYFENAAQMDRASAALLRYLLKRCKFPGLIIASIRTSGQAVSQFETLFSDGFPELQLTPIQMDALSEYIGFILDGKPAAEVTKVVYRHSAGNLIYAEEIIRYWLQNRALQRNTNDEWTFASPETARAIPAPLTNMLKRQVMEKLSEPQRQLLATAALMGAEFTFNNWLTVIGGESWMDAAVETIDRAISIPILREISPERYEFSPESVAPILVETLTLPRQRLIHKQIAAHLTREGGDPVSMAHHFVEGGTTLEAARALEAAGAHAAQSNAVQQAVTFYEKAIELNEALVAQEALGKLYLEQGQAAKSRQAFQRALELARQAKDREAEARVLNNIAFVLWLYDSYVDAYRTAASVLKIEGISKIKIAIAESHLGMVAWLIGELKEAQQHCQRAIELLQTSGELSLLAAAYSRMGLVCFSQGQLQNAESMFNQSLELRRSLRDLWGIGFLTTNLGRIALERGKHDLAWDLLSEAGQLFERIESQDGLMVALTNQGQALIRRGQSGQALPLLVEAAGIAKNIGKISGYGISEIFIFQAQAYLNLQELKPAQKFATEALEIVTKAGNQEYIARAKLTLAEVRQAQGRAEEATSLYKDALELAEKIGCASCSIQAMHAYAKFLMTHGETESAADLNQKAQQLANAMGFQYLP